MGIITFSIAAILSMPKQLITVYLGVILEQSDNGIRNTKSRIISDVLLAVTFLVTILAMWYIFRKMGQAKPAVIYERRKARQAKMVRGDLMPYTNKDAVDSNTAFNPQMSDSDIPLTGDLYQRWDKDGRAVGYAGDPQLHAPQPKHASLSPERIAAGNYVDRYPDDVEATGEHRTGGSSTGKSSSRQDSVDSIGWDMRDAGSQPLHPLSSDRGGSPSQVPGRTNYTHTPEATDSYYSAQSDAYSGMGSETNPTALGRRAFSPPPPSYRTDLR